MSIIIQRKLAGMLSTRQRVNTLSARPRAAGTVGQYQVGPCTGWARGKAEFKPNLASDRDFKLETGSSNLERSSSSVSLSESPS